MWSTDEETEHDLYRSDMGHRGSPGHYLLGGSIIGEYPNALGCPEPFPGLLRNLI